MTDSQAPEKSGCQFDQFLREALDGLQRGGFTDLCQVQIAGRDFFIKTDEARISRHRRLPVPPLRSLRIGETMVARRIDGDNVLAAVGRAFSKWMFFS